ncbi:MAG: glycosyltransferase family 4 protein [Acidobacteria bacterium]|nr:glycosyltransferase family 4 protein [Acidobacteriota bacterium]
MRVLYLTMNPNRESTTVPTEGWFRLLRGRGLEPILVSSRSGAFQAWAREQGIPSYEVPLPFPNRARPWTFLKSLARVVAIGRRHGVQLVHCNEHDIYPIGQYAARLLRVPVVVSVHFTLRDGFSRWAFRGNRAPDRAFFVSATSFAACAPDLAGVLPDSRCRVLYNGLDLSRYRPDPGLRAAFRSEHGLGDGLVAGAACALRPRKQLEHLFRCAAALPSLHVVLAGGPVKGDEDYAAALIAEGRQVLGGRLLHLGHLRELRPMYNALDLFLNTSQEESFGLSVLEAMACGSPVVGYPSVSVAEVVGGSGVIVRQDDERALVSAVSSVVSDPGLRSTMRQAARVRACEFDIGCIADQLWTEYQDLAPSTGVTSSTRAVNR